VSCMVEKTSCEWAIRLIETPEEMALVEALQRLVWPGSETDVVPAHLLLTAAHNGGLVLGALAAQGLVGFAFGFPGFYETPDGPRLKHCSHMLGIHPDWRDRGLGFALKRAQWQLVRRQGVDRITWTYDPLISRNAYLNISRLGAVCNTYRRSEYGEMRDGLNAGLPSDRFQVDWWVHSRRVERRLGRRPRPALTIDQYLASEPPLIAARTGADFLHPARDLPRLEGALLLVEIPPDFAALKRADLSLARDWRFYTREIFEEAFAGGYLATDFIHDRGRSIYVLAQGGNRL